MKGRALLGAALAAALTSSQRGEVVDPGISGVEQMFKDFGVPVPNMMRRFSAKPLTKKATPAEKRKRKMINKSKRRNRNG